jgi:hypothetical protein
MFARTLEEFQEMEEVENAEGERLDKISLSRISVRSESGSKQNMVYLENYYPYILNICISVSLELFYRQEAMETEEGEKEREREMEEDREREEEMENKKLMKLINKDMKLKKIKEEMEMKKEIYQNILEEIFNQHEN